MPSQPSIASIASKPGKPGSSTRMETRSSVFGSKARRISELEERVRDVENDLWLQVDWNQEQVQRIDQLVSQQDKLANDLRKLKHSLDSKGLI
jgi:hypothetical protein